MVLQFLLDSVFKEIAYFYKKEENTMKGLPLGRQDFKGIIESDLVYVDKTPEIHTLISSPIKYIFFLRPRRFGKSLLISTLKYFFQGEKELFKGLHIEDKYDFEVHPVIHIDFSDGIANYSPEILRENIDAFLKQEAQKYELETVSTSLSSQFSYLIKHIFEKTGKQVVILIDEYDKAITDNLTKTEIANQNREVLREFFSGLKNADQYLRMLFITGISRFAKVSIFSMLNNLMDISLLPEFHNLVGFKPDDIEKYFEDYLTLMQKDFGLNREELLTQIQWMYNGYSWDGMQRLYNPYSLTSAFYRKELENYWFESGTPTFLIQMIRERKIFIPDLERQKHLLKTGGSQDLSNLDIISLLFQTGYLTITQVRRPKQIGVGKQYELNYPNEEVRRSMFSYLLSDNTHIPTGKVIPQYLEMQEALEIQDLKTFLKILKATFSKIPARLHLKAEAYYHSLFYMLLHLLGNRIQLEEEQAIGRVDAIIELEDLIYIIEFKYSENKKIEILLEEAMNQIKEKKYYEPYLAEGKKILLLAVGFLGKEEIDLRLEEIPNSK